MVHALGPARFSRPWTVWRARRRLARLLAARAFDAVVCHGCWPHAVFGPVVRRAGRPLVFWLHDLPGGTHWVERRAARTPPDLAIAGSRFASEAIPALFPGVPRAVDPPAGRVHEATGRKSAPRSGAELATPDGTTVILMASRLVPIKGHASPDRRPGAAPRPARMGGLDRGRGADAGRGGLSRSAPRPGGDAGIAGRVRFLGHRSDVPRLLAAADLLCQPNVGPESFGIAFVEAMAAGLPVVTTRIGGGAEVVTEACGVLVPPGRPGGAGRCPGGPDRRPRSCEPASARPGPRGPGPCATRRPCWSGSNACSATWSHETRNST